MISNASVKPQPSYAQTHLSNFQNFAKGFFFKIGNKLKQPLAFREWLHIKSLPTLQDKRFCCGCFLFKIYRECFAGFFVFESSEGRVVWNADRSEPKMSQIHPVPKAT